MFGLGFSEIILLGVLALVLIGPKELPEVARTIGRFLNELKRSSSVLAEDLKEHAKFDIDLHPTSVKAREKKVLEAETKPSEPRQMDFDEITADKKENGSTQS